MRTSISPSSSSIDEGNWEKRNFASISGILEHENSGHTNEQDSNASNHLHQENYSTTSVRVPLLDVHKGRPLRLQAKVLVPVNDHPNVRCNNMITQKTSSNTLLYFAVQFYRQAVGSKREFA